MEQADDATPDSPERRDGQSAGGSVGSGGSANQLRQGSDPDWNVLIPELKDWNNGEGIDPGGWIACSGNFLLAVGYTTLFWPIFVEHDGMVLREGFDPPCLKEWIEHYGGDKSAVEAMMNHLHIGHIHYHGGAEATQERVVHLGLTLRQIYECKLRSQFPERDIIVEFDDSPKADISEYQLTFYQRGIVRG